MLTFSDHSLEKRIAALSDATGRKKSFYIREALNKYLDEMEDTYIALYRLEKPEFISQQELEASLGMDG